MFQRQTPKSPMRSSRRALWHETLEAKIVFDSTPMGESSAIVSEASPQPIVQELTFAFSAAPVEVPSDLVVRANEIAQGFERSRFDQLDTSQRQIVRFDQRETFQFELAKRGAEYWGEILGKTPDESLWRSFNEIFAGFAYDSHSSSHLQLAMTSAAPANGATNAQIANIDEGDLFEISADGFMYVASQQGVKILDARSYGDTSGIGDRIELGHKNFPERASARLGRTGLPPSCQLNHFEHGESIQRHDSYSSLRCEQPSPA